MFWRRNSWRLFFLQREINSKKNAKKEMKKIVNMEIAISFEVVKNVGTHSESIG